MNHSSPAARGPSPLFRQLLPALFLACFAVVVFLWDPFGSVPRRAYFEAQLRPSVAGEVQFLADVDGAGLHKERTMSQPVRAGEMTRVRFQIPAGKLSAFVFSPLVADGEVDVMRCWLTTDNGNVVALVSPESLAASFPAALRLGNGAIRLPGRMGETITALRFDPKPPLDLGFTPPPPAWQLTLVFLGTVIAVLALSQGVAKLPWRAWTTAAWRRIRLHPRWAIFAAAFASTVLSCFPVVFCGKSFISPDNGMQLLYEAFPSVPGALGGRVENPTGADMGATFYWHMPASMIQHRAIFEDGEFPFWNRYNWGGISLWAQCISMLGDPLHWPAVITGGAAWAWDFKFIAAKIIFAFGVGLLVWASSRSLLAALLLALSAPYLGFFTYRFCHAGFFALCYAPWVLLPWLEAIRAPSWRRVTLWAGLLMFANWWQLNSGTAKESSALLVFLNAAGALALLAAPVPWRERATRLGIFTWANVLFVLLSAPLWMPFLDALSKAATYYDPPQVCQMQPGLFIGLFDDIFHRQLMPLEFLANPSANFFILLGAAWALARSRVLVQDGIFRMTLLVAATAAAVAFGVVSPDLLARVPMIRNIYHFDNTFSCVLFILLFVLAGYGLRECHRRMRSPEWRGDWVIVLTIVGVLFGAFLGMTQAAHRGGKTFNVIGQTIPKSEFMWIYGGALFLALAVLPWAWREVRLRRPAAATWLLVALCAWATLHFRHGMYLVTRFDLYTMNPKQRLDMRDLPSPAVAQIKSVMREPARVVGIDWVMTPGFNTVLGLETISGPDALQNPAMRELTAALGIPQMWFWKLAVWHKDFARLHRSLDLLGVRYYLEKPGQGASLPDTKLLGTTDLDVVESETAWPRAFFTDAVPTYGEVGEIAQLAQQGDGRPFATMLLPDRVLLPLPPRPFATRQIIPAHAYRLTQNSTTFEIEASAPGVAVLGEAWLPDDLQVLVDGRPAQVLRVNHAFRGVFVAQPGHHVVQFFYWPAALSPALWLAVIGFFGTVLSGWLLLRRPPAPAGTFPAKSPVRECLPCP
jgi:hypothetical protein